MTISKADRQNVALAKAIAYHDCGKDAEAERWAIALITELHWAGIIKAGTLARHYEGTET